MDEKIAGKAEEAYTKLNSVDGKGHRGRSCIDYDAVFDEVCRSCESLRYLVEKARRTDSPKSRDIAGVIERIRLGDESARRSLSEMYLRIALAAGLKWSKTLDVALQDAVGTALLGLVAAAGNYDPDRHRYFSTYCSTLISRMDPLTGTQDVLEPVSLEAYVDSIGRTVRGGDSGVDRDDAPEYEEGLSGYCVDVSEMAEAGVLQEQRRETVKEILDRLPPKEKKILEYRYWIKEGQKGTNGKIYKYENKALRRIRSRRIISYYL